MAYRTSAPRCRTNRRQSLSQNRISLAPAELARGSIGWVIHRYRDSDEYRDLSLGTVKYYKRFLREMIKIHRAKFMAELPEALFERLLAAGVLSNKALANVAVALKGDPLSGEIARCPHCGEVLRVRPNLGKQARAAIKAWLGEPYADPGTKSSRKSNASPTFSP